MPATTVVATMSLRPISLGSIRKGGYVLGYDGAVPKGVTLMLGAPDTQNAMEVTGRNAKDLLGPDNLPSFLALVGRQKWWGTKGRCRLFAMTGPSVIAQSNEQTFDCPVRPYVGLLGPALGRGDTGPALKYTGTPPGYADGRVLHAPAIDGCHYFAYGGKFETDNEKRGFNCITYVGAVFGVDATSGAMSAYGTQLANHCGCMPCGLENRTLAEVKAFFTKNHIGTYVMWSARHIVLVVNGAVHEFREKLGRYNCEPVAQWQHADDRWWVRKAPKQF